jgi:hypothetical protein
MKDDFDFGFTHEPDTRENDKSKAQEMYDMIMPLLTNLKMNPDKPNIHWPDRVKKIDIFAEKLYSVLNRK